MALVSAHPRGKMLKGFTALGPYIREGQCNDNHFFFDCLAVCINITARVRETEFWGWWINLEALYLIPTIWENLTNEGKWTESAFSDQKVTEKLESSLRAFHISPARV